MSDETDAILLALVHAEYLAMGMPILCPEDPATPKFLSKRRLAEKANRKPRKRRWDAGKRRKWVVKPEPRKGKAA
jgi:hypothetical protein